MKKRLRKKLRLREFQEMGFTIDFDTDDEASYRILDDDLSKLLAKLNLKIVFGYGTLFIRASSYKSVTKSNRKTITEWIQQRSEAINLRFGPLADFKLTRRMYLRRPKWKPLPRKRSYH
ncbi:DUF469 family protein [Microvirga sp. STS02]|uniref:50S ribosome-binding protein YggL n=1 Tax=Hymenobacter negativus TaxID=2795026 RepID=UPI0018DC06C4|nr:DUF469 family protein [Hymenobacter negativus]MBR7209664.1 DUF469 family protein [Microvirga sp. STS02]